MTPDDIDTALAPFRAKIRRLPAPEREPAIRYVSAMLAVAARAYQEAKASVRHRSFRPRPLYPDTRTKPR